MEAEAPKEFQSRRPWWHWRTIKGSFKNGKRKQDKAIRVAAPVSAGSIIAYVLDIKLPHGVVPDQWAFLGSVLALVGILFVLRIYDLTAIGKELVQQQKFTVDAINRMVTTVETDLKRIEKELDDHIGHPSAHDEKRSQGF